MTPNLLKVFIGLAICVVVTIFVIVVMASRSKGSSSKGGSSTTTEESSVPAYKDLPSPSESGEAPAENSAESDSSSSDESGVPDPSDSTIAFEEESPSSSSGTTTTPSSPLTVVPKTYYLRLKNAYCMTPMSVIEIYYDDPVAKKKTMVKSLRIGKITGTRTYDILLTQDMKPSITDVSFFTRSGSSVALPVVHIVEKEGSTDKNVSENFASILYNNNKKKYTKGLLTSTKHTFVFKPKM